MPAMVTFGEADVCVCGGGVSVVHSLSCRLCSPPPPLYVIRHAQQVRRSTSRDKWRWRHSMTSLGSRRPGMHAFERKPSFERFLPNFRLKSNETKRKDGFWPRRWNICYNWIRTTDCRLWLEVYQSCRFREARSRRCWANWSDRNHEKYF